MNVIIDIPAPGAPTWENIREIFESKEFQLAPLYEHEREFGRLAAHPMVISAGIDLSTILKIYDQAFSSTTSALAVMEYIREIFRTYTFNTWTTDQKQAEFDRLAAFPMVTRVHITKHDIIQLHGEIIANSKSLAKLSKDPLFLILSKCDPKSVLNLCRATRNYMNLYCDQTIFVRLMQLHYPEYSNYPLSKNARQQYNDIAHKNGYVYMINIRHTRDSIPLDFTYLGGIDFGNRAVLLGRFENDDASQYGDKVSGYPLAKYYEEDNDEMPQMFKLYGNGLDKDTPMWVVITFTSSSTEPWMIGVDKLALMKEVVENTITVEDYIGRAIEASGEDGVAESVIETDLEKLNAGTLDQASMNWYANYYNYPSPFTEENIIAKFDKDNAFWQNPGNDDWGTGLVQMTFPKAP